MQSGYTPQLAVLERLRANVMGPRRSRDQGFNDQLYAFMQRELHPETAKNIGEMVTRSELLSAEAALAIVMQMKLDIVRQDKELLDSAQGEFVWD